MNAIVVLIKLIAAHLVGDFLFQTDGLCEAKRSADIRKRLSAQIVHALTQAVTAYLFVAQWDNWVVPTVIGASHFIIDNIKNACKDSSLSAFITDQLAHILVIVVLWWFDFFKEPANMALVHYGLSIKAWLILTAYISVLSPASILIKAFMEYEKWIPADASAQGMPNAGKWIGYLERVLILTFIFTNNIEGIGFLLAAKSVFRFGELNKSKDVKTTEYVLIGTLASFAIAILIGFGVIELWQMALE